MTKKLHFYGQKCFQFTKKGPNETKNKANWKTCRWIFHKSRFSFLNANFSAKIIQISLIRNFFCIFAYNLRKVLTKFMYWSNILYILLDLFGWIKTILAKKMPFFGHFYIIYFLMWRVRFWDITDCTKMVLKSQKNEYYREIPLD